MQVSTCAAAIGKGLFAGLIGTAVMTVSSEIEMRLRDRPASDTPARAAGKVLGIQPQDEKAKERFSHLVHWSYGTVWGAARGLIALTGLRGAAAGIVHFLAVWGAAQIMLPLLDVVPPVTEWGVEEIAIDGLHHVVYASAASAAYEFIERH